MENLENSGDWKITLTGNLPAVKPERNNEREMMVINVNLQQGGT